MQNSSRGPYPVRNVMSWLSATTTGGSPGAPAERGSSRIPRALGHLMASAPEQGRPIPRLPKRAGHLFAPVGRSCLTAGRATFAPWIRFEP